MLLRVIRSFVIVLAASTLLAAQAPASDSPESREKTRIELEHKVVGLLEQIVKDGESLKLLENRVTVFDQAAGWLWTRDEKRARALFERAASEIAASFNQSEPNESGLPENFWILQNSRQMFLTRVASRDAELALKLLRQTRPPIYDEVLAMPPARLRLYQNLYSQARSDLQMEQQFAALMAKKNPQRALEIARANLSKGVSHTDLSVIDELKNLAPEDAAKFADEVLQKLLQADFENQSGYNDRNLAANFLARFSAPAAAAENDPANKIKPFRVNASALRQLAEKYVAYFYGNNFQQNNYYEIQSALPITEKILPERAADLRRKFETLKQKHHVANPQNEFYERLNQLNSSSATTAQTLVAEADNFPLEMRSQIYHSAASKLTQAGDYNGARQLIASLPQGQNREHAILNLDQQILNNYLNKDQYAEAEAVVRQQTGSSQKIQLLSVLARHLYNKQLKEKAMQLVAEAVSLASPAPEDFKEMNSSMLALSIAAELQSEKAFELFESLVPKFNEIIAATALLSKYQPHNQAFRENEYSLSMMGHGSFGRGFAFNLNLSSFTHLAKTDFDRAVGIADRLERDDVRMMARLMILRSIPSAKDDSAIYELPFSTRFVSIH